MGRHDACQHRDVSVGILGGTYAAGLLREDVRLTATLTALATHKREGADKTPSRLWSSQDAPREFLCPVQVLGVGVVEAEEQELAQAEIVLAHHRDSPSRQQVPHDPHRHLLVPLEARAEYRHVFDEGGVELFDELLD